MSARSIAAGRFELPALLTRRRALLTRRAFQVCVLTLWLTVLNAEQLRGQPVEPPAAESTAAESTAAENRRAAALAELSKFEELDAEQWKTLSAMLDDEVPEFRIRTLRIYAKHPAQAALDSKKLLGKMSDDQWGLKEPVWQAAGKALAAIGESIVPQLIARLDPSDDAQYRAACVALGELGPQAKPALRRLTLLIVDPQVPLGPALHAVQHIGPDAWPAVSAIMERMDDESFHHQYFCCRALGAIGRQAEPSIPKLLQMLETGVAHVRRHAAIALGQIGIGSPEVVHGLVGALSDKLAPVRKEAIVSLGRLGRPGTPGVPRLREIAENPKGSSQADAAWALWKIGADASDSTLAVEVLFRELRGMGAPWDASLYLSQVATEAKVIPRIIALLDDENEETVLYVIETLGKIGPDANGALPQLKRLATKTDSDISAAAQLAIENIQKVTERPEQGISAEKPPIGRD
jgi:HEAT repeat protein